MRFDIADLRLFLAVVEAGSITAGAARANMALASASERIRAMEEFAVARLLERRHRGVAPTAAGKALARHARDILDAHDRMRGDLARFGRGLKGHVRIMANTSAISEHLPEPLASFLAANAHVDIDLEEGTSREVFEAVAEGRVDFAVASDQVDAGPLETRLFRRDGLVLVCATDHQLAAGGRVAFAEALSFEQIGLGAHSALSAYLAGQARRLGLSIACRIRVGSFEAVCRMAEQGVGIGIAPLSAASRASRSMAIHVAPLDDDWAARSLVIATRRGASLSTHAAALIDWLLRDVESAAQPGEAADPANRPPSMLNSDPVT